MGGRIKLPQNVFEAAVERTRALFKDPRDRVVVSFSAGKDLGVCLEIAILAATLEGRLPVTVTMRDEEILLPGTFEYAERVAERPEVDFRWIVQNHPYLNIYDRRMPYLWAFDPELPPEQWVRRPPSWATYIEEQPIEAICTSKLFPPPHPDGKVYNIVGLRASESSRRMMGLHSAGGYLTAMNPKTGVYGARPIYDMTDSDIFLCISKMGWDYNRAYDVMHKLGIPRAHLRIAPVTMNEAGLTSLILARKAWPDWFDKVCERAPGVRQAALFGKRMLEPNRLSGELWEDCFRRECIDEAPPWIANRSRLAAETYTRRHKNHSADPFPQEVACIECGGGWRTSWKGLAKSLFHGDPFSYHGFLPYVEPAFFRPKLEGTVRGRWGGKPKFAHRLDDVVRGGAFRDLAGRRPLFRGYE